MRIKKPLTDIQGQASVADLVEVDVRYADPVAPGDIEALRRELGLLKGKTKGYEDPEFQRSAEKMLMLVASAYVSSACKALYAQLQREFGKIVPTFRLGEFAISHKLAYADNPKEWRLRFCEHNGAMWVADERMPREGCVLKSAPAKATILSPQALSLASHLAVIWPSGITSGAMLDVLAKAHDRTAEQMTCRPDKLLNQIQKALGPKEAQRLERARRGGTAASTDSTRLNQCQRDEWMGSS
jgi:hypothetical protein